MFSFFLPCLPLRRPRGTRPPKRKAMPPKRRRLDVEEARAPVERPPKRSRLDGEACAPLAVQRLPKDDKDRLHWEEHKMQIT